MCGYVTSHFTKHAALNFAVNNQPILSLRRFPSLEYVNLGERVPSADEWELDFGSRPRPPGIALIYYNLTVQLGQTLCMAPFALQLKSLSLYDVDPRALAAVARICTELTHLCLKLDLETGPYGSSQRVAALAGGNLHKLRELDLSASFITAAAVGHLANATWSELTKLFLQNTWIEETEELGRWGWCSNLESLVMIEFDTGEPDLERDRSFQLLLTNDFSRLREASFFCAHLDAINIEALATTAMPRLESLELSGNVVTENAALSLAHERWRNLKYLGLSSCEMNDDALLALADGKFHGITSMNLRGNQITANGVFRFGAGKFKAIRTVRIDLNDAEGLLPNRADMSKWTLAMMK